MTPPTLVLLPGLACDARVWRDQLPALAETGPVAVSTAHQQADSLPAMAEALLARHEGPLALAGCSMGAMVALHVWRLAPERVRGLALLGSTVRPDTDATRMLRLQAIGMFEQGRADELLRANTLFAFHPQHAGRLTGDYLNMVLHAGSGGLIRQNRAVLQRPDLSPVLATVRCPTLVLGGLDDQITPPDCQREMAAGIAHARLHLLPTCGHMLTWEQPQAVTEHLLDWRRGLTRA